MSGMGGWGGMGGWIGMGGMSGWVGMGGWGGFGKSKKSPPPQKKEIKIGNFKKFQKISKNFKKIQNF